MVPNSKYIIQIPQLEKLSFKVLGKEGSFPVSHIDIGICRGEPFPHGRAVYLEDKTWSQRQSHYVSILILKAGGGPHLVCANLDNGQKLVKLPSGQV